MTLKDGIKRIPFVGRMAITLRAQYRRGRNWFRLQRALRYRKKQGVRPDHILAFWGEDYPDLISEYRVRNGDSLWHLLAEGYSLFPLDFSALGHINAMGLQCYLKGDILSEEEAMAAFDEADVLWADWIAACGSSAEYSGVNWLKEDYASLMWPVLGMCYSARIAKALQRMGIKKFAYISYESKRPAPYYYRTDLYTHIWGELLGEAARPLIMPGGYAPPQTAREESFTVPVKLSGCDILLAFNPGEVHRFFPFIQHLVQEFPQKVCLCLFGEDEATVKYWEQRTSLTVMSIPFPLQKQEDIFEECLERSCKFFASKEWGHGLSWFFNYYTHVRWPALHKWLIRWQSVLEEWNGRCVIGSFLEDLESKIPLVAAEAINIPSYYIPHALFHMPRVWATGWPRAQALCTSLLQLECFQLLLPWLTSSLCSQIDLRQEYKTEMYAQAKDATRVRITVVCGSSAVDGTIIPLCCDRKQADAFAVMAAVPVDLQHAVSIQFKMHPAFSDKELLSAEAKALMCPDTANLDGIIEQSDIVIMPNYFGAPCIFVMESKKPVFFFITSNMIYHRHINPEQFIAHFLRHELWIDNDKFWDNIRKYLTDKKFACSILGNQNDFVNRYRACCDAGELRKIFYDNDKVSHV